MLTIVRMGGEIIYPLRLDILSSLHCVIKTKFAK